MNMGLYYLLGCQFFVPPLLVLVVVVVPADFFAPANFGHHLKQAFFILREGKGKFLEKREETKGNVYVEEGRLLPTTTTTLPAFLLSAALGYGLDASLPALISAV